MYYYCFPSLTSDHQQTSSNNKVIKDVNLRNYIIQRFREEKNSKGLEHDVIRIFKTQFNIILTIHLLDADDDGNDGDV